MAAGTAAWADEKADVNRQGAIRGRIIDTAEQTLPGASIYIEKLHTGVISDVNGFYTFSNLTPGTYRVKVTYVGYSPVEMTITIPEGKTVEKDVVMNEGIELQQVVVGGAFTGQRRALAAQKSNLGITNVVSADQVGKFPDSNIGDALKRISGINVQYDQGEARFGQVRGTSADMSSVTINGNRVPSAEGETRNVQLDLIPADMIQTIEVNKVVTPDMDADAIGGSINLVTKNSPYKRFISATAGTGYNFVALHLRRPLLQRQAGPDALRFLPKQPRRQRRRGDGLRAERRRRSGIGRIRGTPVLRHPTASELLPGPRLGNQRQPPTGLQRHLQQPKRLGEPLPPPV